jgi:outer membrane protein
LKNQPCNGCLRGCLQKVACLGLLVAAAFHGHASEYPLWELGLGLGGLHQSCYIGSKQTCNNAFPVVLPVYRGEFFKSDDKGLRAEFVEEDRYKFDVSADFNFAVDSRDIELREGMPDIGNLLQVGPTFEYTLNKNSVDKLYLNFPLRAVFEISGTDLNLAGYNFSPGIVYVRQFAASSWRVSASLAPQFHSQEYNALYYTVKPEFARPERPAYKAKGGFSGSRLQLALSSNTASNLWVFFFRYDNIDHAIFDDSPLVETHSSSTIGFIYSHYFLKSARLINQVDQ